MPGLGHVVLELVQNVSLFALVLAAYAALRRTAGRFPVGREAAIGLLFGLGAAMAMSVRIEVGPGIYVDGRNVMTSLSGLFCGPIGTMATLTITLAYRVWLGGPGLAAGMVAAILAAAIGAAFRWRLRRHDAKPDASQLLGMGILVVAAGTLAFALLNPGAAASIIPDFGLPLLIVTPIGTLVLGLALQSEDDRIALQRTVHRSEQRLKEAIESIPEGFVLLDSAMKIVSFNRRLLELYPKSAPAVAVGAPFETMLRHGAEHGEYPEIHSQAAAEDFVRRWMERFRKDEPYFGEGAFADGRWVLVSHRKTAGGDYVSVRTDITQQKQRERELADLLQELIASQAATERAHAESQRAFDLLRAITDAVPALIAHLDRDQRYTHCNREYQDIFGIDPRSMIGRSVAEAVPEEVYVAVKPYVEAVLDGREQAFVRPMIVGAETRYVEQRYIPDRDAEGRVVGFYAIAWDITERYRREQELDKEAFTDALTGLLNRRAMMRSISEIAAAWEAGGAHGAVLFLDVDRFKHINDTLGHDAGDELLKIFAERVRSVVRASDKVARLGGDEFVILVTAPDAEEVARRVAGNLLERVRQPVRLGERELAISTSIGVAISPGPETSAARLLKEADLALYEAKAAGRDRYALRKLAAE